MKRIICGILLSVIVSRVSHEKIDVHLDTKNCSCEEHLIDMLVLALIDKTLVQKKKGLIYTISVVVTYLLLFTAVSIASYHY